VSELDAYYGLINQIDNMLADPDAGLSPALQDFFSGAQDVATNPSLLPSRQSMISSGETLVSRFQNIDTTLSQLADQVNGRISDTVNQINTYASQIADINQRVVMGNRPMICWISAINWSPN
jgi:flagellar hook-associated protein 1 FlgK